MSNRQRNRVASLVGALNGKVEIKPASDGTKLAWAEIVGPMQALANAAQNAINLLRDRVVADAAKREGIDLKRYVLDVDKMQWVPRPEVPRDAPVGHPSG